MGGATILIPPPIGPFVDWLGFSVFCSVALPITLIATNAPVKDVDDRIWWTIFAVGPIVGLLLAVPLWLFGAKAPDCAIVATITCGFFAGYAFAEAILRRIDAASCPDSDSPM